MAVNQSSKEKTIKSMYKSLERDLWTIDRTLLYGYYDGNNIYSTESILDNFRDYFEQFVIEVDVAEKFFYQPTAFSEYYYGTPDLDFLVLYFAKIPTMLEFNRKKIKVLPKSRLAEVGRLMSAYREDIESSYKNPTKNTL